MSDFNQLRTWQLIVQAVAIFGLVYGFTNGLSGWLWFALGGYFFYGFFGSTVGFHRLEAHRSFKTYEPIRYFLIFCGMCHTNASPLASIIVHRNHHKFADTKRDIHSPVAYDIKTAYFNEWFADNLKVQTSLARKEITDPFYQFTHRWYIPILIAYAALLLLIDWKLAVYGYFVPAALLYHAKGLFNVLPHKWGYRNFITKDNSRNNWFLNIITLGDGWHNNHHAHPERWDTKVLWWEIDPAAWFIRLIRIKE